MTRRPRPAGTHADRPAALERLGRLVVRRPVSVLVVTGILVLLAATLGGGAVSRLSTGGFVDPGSESSRASEVLEQFGGGEPNYLLLVTATGGRDVDDAAAVRDGRRLTATLAAREGVGDVRSYWTAGRADPLRSHDGGSALVLARLAGDEDQVKARAGELTEQLEGRHGVLDVRAGGSAEVYRHVSETAEQDLVRAELLAFPLTFLLLVVVMGSLVTALLPVAVGAVAVLGTLLVLAGLTAATDVSVFALNLTTALGLGLAIDYSLFVVARFREELSHGAPVEDAVVATVATAGRTVVFSAVTVGLSLAALLLFPLYFLRSFSYAGIPVVLVAAAAAVVVLPAALALLGHRVNALRVRRLVPARHAGQGENVWGRLASASMRRPVPVATAAVLLLLLLGSPFLGIRLGLTDDRNLPPTSAPAQVHESIRADFDARENDPLVVVATAPTDAADVAGYAAALSRVADVARVDSAAGTYVAGDLVAGDLAAPVDPGAASARAGTLTVVPAVEPLSPAGERLVEGVRAEPAPVPVLVGGSAARLVDTTDAITSRLPLAIAMIAVSVGALLFAFFGSLLIPVKALLVNVLSLSATFGVLVWGFQDGRLSSVLGDFTVTGTTDLATPVLLFCVAFGLAMDYEVFLLSRIKEEWEATGDNTAAVVAGVRRTGGIITSAALLVSVVFLSFASSGITSLKMLGIGLTVAVLVDVTLVRGALVPAVMRLAGPANWWAPEPLRRLHARIALHETVSAPVVGRQAPTRTPDPVPSSLQQVLS